MDDFYYKKLKAYQAVHYYTVKAVQKSETLEHSFQKYLNSVYTFI